MATQVQWRGGSTAEHATFTGAAREVTVDTQKKTLVVHDGSTAGGEPLLREDQANLPSSVTNGLYTPGTNQLALSTNGTPRVQFGTSEVVFNDDGNNYDFRIEGDTVSNLFFVDASADAVGIGTSSPSELLSIGSGTVANRTANGGSSLSLLAGGYLTTGAGSSIELGNGHGDAGNIASWLIESKVVQSGANRNNNLTFSTRTSFTNTLVERFRIDSSGRVGIGTQNPNTNLEVTTAADGSDAALISLRNAGGANSSATLRFVNSTSPLGAAKAEITALRTATDGTELIFKRQSNLESARFDQNGRLLVGTSSKRTNVREGTDNETPKVQFESATNDYSESGLSIINNSSSGFAPQLWLGRSASDSIGGNALVSSGRIGSISFNAADGTNFIQGARIQADIDGTSGSGDLPTRLVFSTTADGASSPTERMRIGQSGQISFFTNGDDSGTTAGINFSVSGGAGRANWFNPAGATRTVQYFYYSTTEVGSIAISSTATAYNTSSDYRLKENVAPVTDGIARLQQLKPSRFNFIADPGKTVDGFLAHEVQTIVPEAITGEKDAVDDEGNPVYQGIDQSKLVPLLTAALQEAIGRIETLEAEVAALKAS